MFESEFSLFNFRTIEHSSRDSFSDARSVVLIKAWLGTLGMGEVLCCSLRAGDAHESSLAKTL